MNLECHNCKKYSWRKKNTVQLNYFNSPVVFHYKVL